MDSQFNSLIQSYSSNYIQYKVTGASSYLKAYQSAQQGIDTIIKQLEDEVSAEQDQISSFYKSGVEEKLSNLQQRNSFLQRSVLSDDVNTTATLRAQQTTPTLIPMISTWQYIVLGVLGVTAIGLSVV